MLNNTDHSKSVIALEVSGCDKRKKGLVKLIKRMKIAHSILQSVSNQFHVIILSLPM